MKKLQFVAPLLVISLLTGCSVEKSAGVSENATKPSEKPNVEWAFTQAEQHPEKKLIEVIDGTKSSLDIAIYSLTKPDIVQAIEKAHERGVQVRIITDHQEAQNKTQQQALKRLREKGIPIKENTHKGLMHLKVTIADKSVVTTGSFNYTTAASTTNDEVFVVIHDPIMAKDWEAQFEHMWNDRSKFTDLQI
ncbi:phospholipase D [Collibacillus ludicampi]|uniref:phospholipase D n=1 Tax=Collibacillus ludicampi TaxID=2771369 RepID=A0AAV4LHH0_9BACL|nr:phospholipase D family protein [Collibacillus ludicampi]GIM47267.1 phospholipase D [Collibacillus ludicampi]